MSSVEWRSFVYPALACKPLGGCNTVLDQHGDSMAFEGVFELVDTALDEGWSAVIPRTMRGKLSDEKETHRYVVRHASSLYWLCPSCTAKQAEGRTS